MMNRFLICSKAVMINNLLRGVLGMVAVLGIFVCFGGSVFAGDLIRVKYSGNSIFNEDNIYPGWSNSESVQIKNKHTTDTADLYITVDVKGDKRLAGALKYYIIRDGGSYRVGGSGDKYTLKTADEKRLYIGKLEAGEEEKFRIKIKFNKDAGNEYQGLRSDFDFNFVIEGDLEGDGSEDDILNSQWRTRFTGNAPNEDDIIVSAEDTPETAGIQDENKDEDSTEIKGEMACYGGWPLWMWLLLLLTGSVGIYFVGGFKNEKIILPVQLVVIAGIFALWYFIDGCGSFEWVPYVDTIGGLAIVGALYNQRAKLRE